MISESRYWKDPLLAMAARLRGFAEIGELSEDQHARIERDVFIGFYTVRKLLESPAKVTDDVRSTKLKLRWYPNTSDVNFLNNHRFEDLYDFESENVEEKDLRFICGRIIHSFVFCPLVQEGLGVVAFVFTSDYDRNKRIYSIDLESVIELFELVGNSWPSEIRWLRNRNGGDDKLQVE